MSLIRNTVVSGLLWKSSPHQLLAIAGERRDISLHTSPKLLAELADVLSRDKLAAAIAATGMLPEALMRKFLSVVQIVTPATVPPVILADPDDDHVLACALAAGADLVVSGDRHLLQLQSHRGISIVNATEALRYIELSKGSR